MKSPIYAPKNKVRKIIDYLRYELEINATFGWGSSYNREEKINSVTIWIYCPYWSYNKKGEKECHTWDNHEWNLHNIIGRLDEEDLLDEWMLYRKDGNKKIACLTVWWEKDKSEYIDKYDKLNDDLWFNNHYLDNNDYDDEEEEYDG